MTFDEFKRKWRRFEGKESSAYQEHFSDLCAVLQTDSPAKADPSGAEFFCFQKRVVKDLELFPIQETDEMDLPERGFADVWKKGCFAWEYKGKKKNLDEAYKQLLRYRESLLNPPLLVVCDFERYIIRTNFNGTVQEVYEFTNDEIDRPENLRVLRALFSDPDFLKPQKTTAQVTEELAAKIADLARSLQKRESLEFEDAKSRKQVVVAQRKNLRIARFLNRLIFCFFAEDSKLLPDGLFSQIAKIALNDPKHFATALEELFQVMAKGGMYGPHKIRHFNGHLFEEATVFELNDEELAILASAAEADWQFIQPSIMGTLFERALEPEQRSQLGAHYTSEDDIRTLVEPVLMAPLRREWSALKAETARAYAKGKGAKIDREKLSDFLKKLSAITVLDPACGSGNFLYVSLQLLLALEKAVIAWGGQMGFTFKPQVSVQQLKAIEINPYAYELAQVSVQIGYLQWRRDNGFDNNRRPVLQHLKGFENKDALLYETFRKQPKNLKQARAEEHQSQDELFKVYHERAWPECDVIVGNPPFLGGKLLRRELGDRYLKGMFEVYLDRVRPEADLCCYWFEKARDHIENKKCRRAGLLATQGIRGGANRQTLVRIKNSGSIFFAISDREWILAGATVHVSMVGFDAGSETFLTLDGREVNEITAQLSTGFDVGNALPIRRNAGISFMGITPAGPFDIPHEVAEDWLLHPNASGRPNSDVLRPYVNGLDINQRSRWNWTIDFGTNTASTDAAFYETPFHHLATAVKPIRSQNRRKAYAVNWWLYAEPRPAMRQAFLGKERYLATSMVAKHRIFSWIDSVILPANVVIVFALDDDFSLGILTSRAHLVWANAQGTQLREKESGSRYTPTSCFETFPFPWPVPTVPDDTKSWLDSAHHYFKESAPLYVGSEKFQDVVDAAHELNALRSCWVNPPEWTKDRILRFPGSYDGPWTRYIDPKSVDAKGIGRVQFLIKEPATDESAISLKSRTLTDLYNKRPHWLQFAHEKLDAAVATAYGWPTNISDDQILERLLTLNLERAAAEKNLPRPEKKRISRDKHESELI